MKRVKITANGCAIFPTGSVIEVHGFEKPVKTVKNKENGNNFIHSLLEFEEFEGETTHFCVTCGKEMHDPEGFMSGVLLKYNYDFMKGKQNGTCYRCKENIASIKSRN